MFSEVFIKKLIEDINSDKANIEVKTSCCLEPVYTIIISKREKTYKFEGISKKQITMLEYLLGV
jgi:hypothetical protein